MFLAILDELRVKSEMIPSFEGSADVGTRAVVLTPRWSFTVLERVAGLPG